MKNDKHRPERVQFGETVRRYRDKRSMTQEALAEQLGKTVEAVSYIERAERSPSFETILDLANAFGIPPALLFASDDGGAEASSEEFVTESMVAAPISNASVIAPVDVAPVKEERGDDLQRLNKAFEGIRNMQKLASEYGIHDIFQDNGGKVLQALILLGLKSSPGREGNDAVDAEANEYELKTVNIAQKKSQPVTTHHHLNSKILAKYRAVKAWYIAIYNGIELQELWRVHPEKLEPLFSAWEKKIDEGVQLNNPKIALSYVRSGECVWRIDKNDATEKMTLAL